MESKSASDPREHPHNSRVSSFDVRPSVVGMIGDSEGNLDEKKTVAALSQTHNTNKYLRTGVFVLTGVVFVLIAANIGISVAVAYLTRQLIVDPVTGMATIAGSDDIVMKTSEAVFKAKDTSLHTVPIDSLSAVKTVEFKDGDISLDVKGFARMTNETILLVEGGSFVFDVNGFKNITGDGLTRLFSSINDDMESSDLDGRRLAAYDMYANVGLRRINLGCRACNGYLFSQRIANGVPNIPEYCCKNGFWGGTDCLCGGALPGTKAQCYPLSGVSSSSSSIASSTGRCGPNQGGTSCPGNNPYCNEANGWCGSTSAHQNAQSSTRYDYGSVHYVVRCGPGEARGPGFNHYSCPSHLPYCNEAISECISRNNHHPQESTEYYYYPHCHE